MSTNRPARFYYERAGALNRELKDAIPTARLRELHSKQAWRHFLIVGRQLAILVAMPLLIWHFQQAWIWIPAAILEGFVVFGFSVLLHEVVHKCVFTKDRPRLYAALGIFYGTLSGLAAAQFRRWHLDHHNELGSTTADPKRAYLSPKRNARWYKLLYCTPALFPIYFRAAAKANKGYTPELQRQIKRERLFSIFIHLSVLGCFFWLSPVFALKAYVIPVFFIFPIAFTLNRLGQHYVIDPNEIAKWSTLIRPNAAWNFLFLYSSYHLEHHYFPAVPFYKLKALQSELEPFFKKHQIAAFSYHKLLQLWFIRNHKPHTCAE